MTSPYEVRQVTANVARILAPNPSAWTLEGTNTWVVGTPESSERAVIDPGPVDEGHLDRIVASLGGRSLTQIWLTHSHGDHAAAASTLAARTGATVYTSRTRGEQHRVSDGEEYLLGGVRMRVLAIPGHTLDSLGFELVDEDVVFTGDTILGKGSSMVGPGLRAPLLATLARLENLAEGRPLRGFPGHGEILDDLGATAAARLASRARRIADVEVRAQSGATLDEIFRELYAHITEPSLRMAARSTVESILEYLEVRDQDLTVSATGR